MDEFQVIKVPAKPGEESVLRASLLRLRSKPWVAQVARNLGRQSRQEVSCFVKIYQEEVGSAIADQEVRENLADNNSLFSGPQ